MGVHFSIGTNDRCCSQDEKCTSRRSSVYDRTNETVSSISDPEHRPFQDLYLVLRRSGNQICLSVPSLLIQRDRCLVLGSSCVVPTASTLAEIAESGHLRQPTEVAWYETRLETEALDLQPNCKYTEYSRVVSSLRPKTEALVLATQAQTVVRQPDQGSLFRLSHFSPQKRLFRRWNRGLLSIDKVSLVFNGSLRHHRDRPQCGMNHAAICDCNDEIF